MEDSWNLTDIRTSTGKGRGVFAKEPIKAGTRVLADKILLKPHSWDKASGLWRAKELQKQIRALNPSTRASLLQLANAYDDFLQYQDEDESVVQMDASETEVQILKLYDVTAFSTGLCLRAVYLNHSCVPNLVISNRLIGEEQEALFFYAVRDIAADEELNITYVDLILERQKRQKELKKLRVNCDCRACKDDPIGNAHEKRLAEIRTLRRKLKKCFDLESESNKARDALQHAKQLVNLVKDEPAFLWLALHA